MAQDDAIAIYFVILAHSDPISKNCLMHLLQNIFILENMELKLEKIVRIF